MIPDPLAMGVIVSIAAVVSAHLGARIYLVVLAIFAVVWVFAARGLTADNPGSLALVVLLFLLAAGLAVAATVHMVRMFFRDRALSRMQITLFALVGSAIATFFLFLIFSR